LTVIAGCDAWSAEQSVDFFGQAIAIAGELGIAASFEPTAAAPSSTVDNS